MSDSVWHQIAPSVAALLMGALASARLVGLLFWLVAALLAMPGTASADNRDVPPWPTVWQASELSDHPLVGKIWSRELRGFVSPQDYGTTLAKTRFILLGEVHDNPDHHRLQAWAIRTVSKLRGARIVEGAPQMDVVAMEMLTADEQAGLDRFYGRNARVPRPRTAADFGRLMKWEKLGWPDYKIYQPIIEEALSASLVITPASPARWENRKVSRKGFKALGETEPKRLGLDTPLDKSLAAALADEIRDSHCGMLPETALPNMSLVQRLRDARMADAMLQSESKGAALIAGNGHVRRDRGVPWYLAERAIPDRQIIAVRHIEVEDGKADISDYGLSEGGAASQLADFVVFTPRQPRTEPCEEMRRQMEAINTRHKAKDAATESGSVLGSKP